MQHMIMDFYKNYLVRDNIIIDLDKNITYEDKNIDVLKLPQKIQNSLESKRFTKLSKLIYLTNDVLHFYGFDNNEINTIYLTMTDYFKFNYLENEAYIAQEESKALEDEIQTKEFDEEVKNAEIIDDDSIDATESDIDFDDVDIVDATVSDIEEDKKDNTKLISKPLDDLGFHKSLQKYFIFNDVENFEDLLFYFSNNDFDTINLSKYNKNNLLLDTKNVLKNIDFNSFFGDFLTKDNEKKLNSSITRLQLSFQLSKIIKKYKINTVEDGLKFVINDKVLNIRKYPYEFIIELISKLYCFMVETNNSNNTEVSLDPYLLRNSQKTMREYFSLSTDNDNMETSQLPISVRSVGGLLRANCKKLKDIIDLPLHDLATLKNVGAKSFKEIIDFVLSTYDSKQDQGKKHVNKNINELSIITFKNLKCLFTELSIKSLINNEETLSNLNKLGITNISDLLSYSIYDIYKLSFLSYEEFYAILFVFKFVEGLYRTNSDYRNLAIKEIALNKEEFIYDAPLWKIFDKETTDILKEKKLFTLLDLLNSREIVNVFTNKANDIKNQVVNFIENYKINVNDQIYDLIQEMSKAIEFYEFKGIDISVFKERFKEIYDENLVEKALDIILTCGIVFKYEDNKLFFKYLSFRQFVYITNPKEKEIIFRRLSGDTLEEIGNDYELTRERIRQKEQKYFSNIDKKYNYSLFKEDKYAYIFKNYDLKNQEFKDMFNETESTYHYLDMRYKKGKNEKYLDIINDENVPPRLRSCVEKYTYKDFIEFEDEMVHIDRTSLLKYYARKYMIESISTEDFFTGFNDFLKQNNLQYLLVDNIRYFSKLHICDYLIFSVKTNWRYYDFYAYDYSELLETLNLNSYKHIPLSTLKFFLMYPDLMKEYDIRDQYELHNVLKVLSIKNNDDSLIFTRTPRFSVGDIDTEKFLLNKIKQYQPIKMGQLCKIIFEETGIEDYIIQQEIYKYAKEYIDNMGVINISNSVQSLTYDEYQQVSNKLGKDFYFEREFFEILKEFFGDEYYHLDLSYQDYNLMGYTAYSGYFMKNGIRAVDYFKNLLSDEIIDISKYHDYLQLPQFSSTFTKLRDNFDLIKFDKNLFINFTKLANFGITKNDIYQFIDDVKNFDKKEFIFNVYSLKNNGFQSKLFDLGFDDVFYNSILASSNAFFGNNLNTSNYILYESKDKKSVNNLIKILLEDRKSMDIDDLDAYFMNTYDVKIDIDKLKYSCEELGMYYSPILNRIYLNYKTYYKEV